MAYCEDNRRQEIDSTEWLEWRTFEAYVQRADEVVMIS